MWELDPKESWVLRNWCIWTVVLEKTLESPLDFREIKPVHPKGDQSWIFFGRTDADAETPILWPPDVKSCLIRKDPDAGKDWGQEEKGMTEDEMVGWHHRLNGHEFEQASGDGEAWCAAVHRVVKSQTRLSNWTTSSQGMPTLLVLAPLNLEYQDPKGPGPLPGEESSIHSEHLLCVSSWWELILQGLTVAPCNQYYHPSFMDEKQKW